MLRHQAVALTFSVCAIVATMALPGTGQEKKRKKPDPSATQKKIKGLEVSDAIGTRAVAYLQSMIGKRLAGGECGQMAIEALRAGGADFTYYLRHKNSSDAKGDFVWGKHLQTFQWNAGRVTFAVPKTRFQPGDVIQYCNATFANGAHTECHTSVVAAVDSQGNVAAIYEQNVPNATKRDNGRYVQRRKLDLNRLVAGLRGGWLRVYRPVARPKKEGRLEFTIVNNTKLKVSVQIDSGPNNERQIVRMTQASTIDSYHLLLRTPQQVAIVLGAQAMPAEDGAGYEIYRTSKGVAEIRKLKR